MNPERNNEELHPDLFKALHALESRVKDTLLEGEVMTLKSLIEESIGWTNFTDVMPNVGQPIVAYSPTGMLLTMVLSDTTNNPLVKYKGVLFTHWHPIPYAPS